MAWPGRESVKSAVVGAGDFVDQYRDPAPERGTDRLGGLEFDFDSTAWILARKAAPGEFSNHDQLMLQDRYTYVLNSREVLITRHREVVQLLSENATQRYEAARITFRADGEMPRLICARIITPEGQVRAVSTADILVTAHRDDEADVSDTRDLVIPFGLEARDDRRLLRRNDIERHPRSGQCLDPPLR